MNYTSPFMPEFWESYRRMMNNTLEQAQNMMKNMEAQTEMLSPHMNGKVEGNQRMNSQSPDIRVDSHHVTVTFQVDKVIDKNNTQIHLEGCYLIVDGSIKARITLPAAVQKYGGRAVSKPGVLEVTLPLDKYHTKQIIPIENV